jgi:hypothetical protein
MPTKWSAERITLGRKYNPLLLYSLYTNPWLNCEIELYNILGLNELCIYEKLVGWYNCLKTTIELNCIEGVSSYRVVNTLRLGYKGQYVNDVKYLFFFLQKMQTYKWGLYAERRTFDW